MFLKRTQVEDFQRSDGCRPSFCIWLRELGPNATSLSLELCEKSLKEGNGFPRRYSEKAFWCTARQNTINGIHVINPTKNYWWDGLLSLVGINAMLNVFLTDGRNAKKKHDQYEQIKDYPHLEDTWCFEVLATQSFQGCFNMTWFFYLYKYNVWIYLEGRLRSVER